MVIFLTLRLYPLLVFWQKNVCTCNCNGKTGRQPKSGCIFYTDLTFGSFFMFYISISRYIAVIWKYMWIYRLRLCLPTYYAIKINSRQYFKFLSYFWNTLMLHNSVDYAHTNIYTKMTMVVYNMFYSRCMRSGPPHQIIFTLYSYLSFLTAFITILVGLLVQISIYITAIITLI